MDIREKIRNGLVYFDGGMGTMLQTMGLAPGQLPELWGLTHPDKIMAVHKAYLAAGCDVISANTFGANGLKFNGKNHMPDLKAVVQTAMLCAKTAAAAAGGKQRYVALDLGPTGRLLSPLGDLDFEDAVAVFSETVRIGAESGADLVLIETMNDSYETKAAVLAAKESCTLPVFVTTTYDENGKLMTGADCAAMVAMLEGLGADALGVNCGLGPDKLQNVVESLTKYASIPVIVTPNAGLPSFDGEKTVYNVGPAEFAERMAEFVKMGVHGLGGCCGTTPAHMEALVAKTENLPPVPLREKNISMVSSYTHAVTFGNTPVLIGERINPTGKSALKAALREGDMDYILNEGLEQKERGAHVLDVNAGLPDIDETAVLKKVVCELQAVCDLPLQIDTSDPEAMETALRVYNGKPMINSVCGKRESMEAVFPLAAKYGGLVVALTLDENGIPETAEGRFAIAEKIYAAAAEYGIRKKDIIIDPLAMTISADTSSALATLGAVKMVKAAGGLTSLGVSNVSFGLPRRDAVNAAFFAMALEAGLSAAIMNPKALGMMDTYYAFAALSNKDEMCKSFIAYAQRTPAPAAATPAAAAPSAGTVRPSASPSERGKNAAAKESVPKTAEESLREAIIKGLKDKAAALTKTILAEREALFVIDSCIIPALDVVGKGFENKTTFLPQLLMSAESAKASFAIIKQSMKKGETGQKKCKIVIATVKGDIHDIGKNIVKVLLENYGFSVTDLGKDVPPEAVAQAAEETGAALVGLSALMTTTVPSMEETIKLLHKRLPQVKTVVGGAVLTQKYADMIGADKYARDAMETVRYAEQLEREMEQ